MKTALLDRNGKIIIAVVLVGGSIVIAIITVVVIFCLRRRTNSVKVAVKVDLKKLDAEDNGPTD